MEILIAYVAGMALVGFVGGLVARDEPTAVVFVAMIWPVGLPLLTVAVIAAGPFLLARHLSEPRR